jgi:cyclic beta-1,2-glucan synthetase
LEWETAAAAERRLSGSRWSAIWHLWYVPLVAIVGVFVAQGEGRWWALPIAVIWFVSPLVAHGISQPRTTPRRSLPPFEEAALREIARLTWAFFETYVGSADNWLPPDNLQEYPHEKIAHRVSPTNEGLYLTAVLTARQFGYVGLHAAADLWEQSLASCRKLQRLHGHFYNWYDTQTLEPLFPRYISTVDSGNLTACLLTVHEGIAEWQTAPVFSPRHWDGLRETI